MSTQKFFVLASVLFLSILLCRIVNAQEKPAEDLARVTITLNGEEWAPGKNLAICVQTGLRGLGRTGKFQLSYSFRVRKGGYNPESKPQFFVADTSFVLVDADENLITTFHSTVSELLEEDVKRAVEQGEELVPGYRLFTDACGGLTGTTVKFIPREEEVKKQ
jgi:hypothetical protein